MEAVIDAVVVDANIALGLSLPLPYTHVATTQFELWSDLRVALYAPLLWEYEIASTLRKAVAVNLIAPADADDALDRLMRLPLSRVSPDLGLHRSAIRWAGRLGLTVAYDAQYLALAERLGAELWTADRGLAARAGSAGAAFVHCLLSG